MPIINQVKELSERIEFIEVTSGKDDYGQPVQIEKTIFSCWASVRTQLLKDMVASIGTILEGSITFIIRYDQDYKVTNTMRVKWKNKQYEIISINEGVAFKDYTTVIAKLIK